MYILGISAYYHDSSACIVKDGKIIVALEEERFTRIKHDNSFPENAIKKCLIVAGVKPDDIDHIAYYEKPLLKFERTLEIFIKTWPKERKNFVEGMSMWLGEKLRIKNTLKNLGFKKNKIFFSTHHLSHASATFFTSPFKQGAILTIDGVGEYQTTVLWKAKGRKITSLKEICFPHSLGLLYSSLTAFLGFQVNNDEYKIMGLAAYGKPKYEDKFRQVVDLKKDGSFKFKIDIFQIKELEKIFGKSRKVGEKITQKHKDITSSLQKFTEKLYFKILNYLFKITKEKNLCIAGGVGLNSLANGKIYDNTPFKNVWIFGPSGDGGAAIGAAFSVYYWLNKNKSSFQRSRIAPLLSLGTEYSDKEILNVLKTNKLKFRRMITNQKLIQTVALLLSQGKIIGWFQGRMEFGPRALGNRSILVDPRLRQMKNKVNLIKKREQFRPFAGSVLRDKAKEYFDIPLKDNHFPFMNFVFPVKDIAKSKIASIVHKDGTCRVQTVSKNNDLYYSLIKEFYKKTGVACLLNTSFNIKGEPIVESPEQAIEDFLRTKIDYLAIGKFLAYKD